jgi:aspartyl-tRNA(Asn)/glutamyl-tRNA(Gln) amidotransferase subunit C
MSVSRNEIEHIAALAKLKLTPAELERFRADLSKIFGYLDILKQVDTQGGELQPVTDVSDALRDDKVRPSLPVAEAIGNARVTERNMFSVPKVIEK